MSSLSVCLLSAGGSTDGGGAAACGVPQGRRRVRGRPAACAGGVRRPPSAAEDVTSGNHTLIKWGRVETLKEAIYVVFVHLFIVKHKYCEIILFLLFMDMFIDT